jgi:hypothetical protein
VIGELGSRAEASCVTRRAWMLLAVGALLAASLGGFVLAKRGSSAPFKASPSWGVFTPAQWGAVTAGIERRGFAASGIRVVEVAGVPRRRPFALVAATAASGRTCFVPVRGVALGPTVCRIAKPVVLWTQPAHWHGLRVTNVLGLARHDVTGVSVDQLLSGRHSVGGLPLIAGPGLSTFAGGFTRLSVLRARNAQNRVLFQLNFART